jgi:apolipoprotein N-acyltransferase
MKQWLSDVFKIGFGVSLGFVFLIVLAFALEDWVWPAIRALSGLLFGEGV